jgi:hypothetical protein
MRLARRTTGDQMAAHRKLDQRRVCLCAGWVSAVDSEGRTIWVADAYRGDGKRFVVRADEKLTAFVELASAVRVQN